MDRLVMGYVVRLHPGATVVAENTGGNEKLGVELRRTDCGYEVHMKRETSSSYVAEAVPPGQYDMIIRDGDSVLGTKSVVVHRPDGTVRFRFSRREWE